MPAKTSAKPNARKPVRPTHLAHGRWLGDFPNLSAAELRLVECCARGEVWMPEGWDWDNPVRPEKVTKANSIRAGVIRFLLLGGDALHPVHEAGVMVWGAWIEEKLNFGQCHAAVRLDAQHCHFDAAPIFVAAHLPELSLIGSLVPGMVADGIKVAGDVFLRDGFAAEGEVRLLGAEIGGTLACGEGRFANAGGNAFNADGINVAGSVFLRDGFSAEGAVRLLGAEIGGTLACGKGRFANAGGKALHADRIKVAGSMFLHNGFSADGEVRLLGAEIGGNLECDEGRFANAGGNAFNADGINVAGSVFLRDGFLAEGEVRLLGAEIDGDLACGKGRFANAGGDALSADGIKVAGSLFLRMATIDGAILLASARIGELIDDEQCWQSGGHHLDGLHYDRITGGAPTDAARRIAWLNHQRDEFLDNRNWKPQPWEQAIKVLRDMGHRGAADKIAIEKQKMMRSAGQLGTLKPKLRKQLWKRFPDQCWTYVANRILRGGHFLYGAIAGYGYRPIRAIVSMGLLFGFLFGAIFHWGSQQGVFGPSDPLIHNSRNFDQCGLSGENGKKLWTSSNCPSPPEYTSFQPYWYSFDLLLPFIDLQQADDWSPAISNGEGEELRIGILMRWLMWIEILLCWIGGGYAAARLSRLIEKESE